MKATKLTIIAVAVAAVVFGGCSNDSQILGPGSDLQTGAGIDRVNRLDSGSNESVPEPEYFVILAKVEMLDIENECLYLQSDEGKTYTPVTPKDLVLEAGLALKAEGYVDNTINFFCGNGPAFVIENYEILSKPKMGDNDRDSDISTEYASSDNEIITDEMTEERAPVNMTEDRPSEEQMDRDRELKEKYKGDYVPSEPPNEKAGSGTADDDANDRYVVPSEDRYSKDEDFERELEEKKIIEQEKSGEQDNDGGLVTSDDSESEDEEYNKELEEKKRLEEKEEEELDKDTGNDRP
jgi:predicted small secreted protein